MASPLPSSLLRVRVCVTYFSCVDSSLARALYIHSARYLHALMRTRNTPTGILNTLGGVYCLKAKAAIQKRPVTGTPV